MWRNYLITTFRSIIRNRLSTFLNVFGLAAGIVSCLFIYLYVSDELSYDKHFSKADRIYRIQCFYKFEDIEDKFGIVPFSVVDNLKKDNPEIEDGTKIFLAGNHTFKKENTNYDIDHVYLSDSNFFQIFDFPFVYGDAATSLLSPRSLVLTLTESERLFGNVNPVGKALEWNKYPLKITGVIDDKSVNTHIELGAFVSVQTAKPDFIKRVTDDVGNNNSFSYIVLKDNVDAKKFQAKLNAFVDKYLLPFWKSSGFNGQISMYAEPLKDIHFNNYLIYDTEKKGNLTYVYIFSVVAIIILIIACINFINLATATASSRAKEVGMRKVLGAQRSQLIIQFLGEAFIITFFSFVLAMVFLEVLLPFFNNITGKSVTIAHLFHWSFTVTVISLLIFVSVVAGSYPAFYISRLPVQAIFRDARTALGKSGTLRKVLVTSQFALSIAMIIATLSVLGQLNYMRHKDLGFTKDNMMVLTLPIGDSAQVPMLKALKQELLTKSTIANAARTAQVPGSSTSRYVLRVNTKHKKEDKPIAVLVTDENYLSMANMRLSQGRFFTEDDQNLPSGAALVNEAAVKLYGWDNPLQEKLVVPGEAGRPDEEIKVVGVIKDFHFASLHHPIEPLVMLQQNAQNPNGVLVVQLKGNDVPQAIADVGDAWKKTFPTKPMEYEFLSDNFNKMYVAEEKMFSIFIYFAALAILLSCLGLYGLSAYTTQQRTKEIGIRKVMGASAQNIVLLLNKDFLKLVVLAIVLAFPVAWYIVLKWLQNFAYHDAVNPVFFITAGLFAVTITALTVSMHAWITVARNPVRALRYE